MADNRTPGGVAFQRFEPIAVDQSPAIGTPVGSTAGDIERVAGSLSRLSQTIGRNADIAATREGQDAGALAGMDPEFRHVERNTRFAQAFNATGDQVFLSQLETHARTEMEAAATEAGHDPAALTARFDGLQAELRASTALQQSPVLAASFDQMFARNRLPYERQAARGALAAQRTSQTAAVAEWTGRRLTDLDRMAREAGLDPAADVALAGEMDTLAERLAAYGPQEAFSVAGRDYEPSSERAGALSPEQIGSTLTSARRTMASGRVLGAFSRVEGLGAQQRFHAQFMSDAEAGDGPYGDMTRQDINRLDTAMTRTIRQGVTAQNGVRRAAVRDLRAALRQATAVTGEGLNPGPDVFEAIATRAEGAGDGLLAQEARQAGGVAAVADWALGQPAVVLNEAIAGERARLEAQDSVSPFEAARLGALERVAHEQASALQRDPLSVGVRAGLVELSPIRMLDDNGQPSADVFAASLGARAQQAEAVAQHYGAGVRYFTQAERSTIEAAASGYRGVAEQAAALDAIASLADRTDGVQLSEFSAPVVADAALYARYARLGMEPSRALEMTVAARQAQPGSQEAILRQEARTWLDHNLDGDRIERDLSPGGLPFTGRAHFSSSAQRAAAEADYRAAFDVAYQQHGDPEAAADQAVATLQRSWGQSRVMGGRRLMQYPPERFYSVPGAGVDWMRQQLVEGVTELSGAAPSHIQLVSDTQTAREAQNGVAPSYHVVYQDANGELQAVPQRWRFDPSAIAADAPREGDPVGDARFNRDLYLDGLADANSNLRERAIRDWLVSDAGGGQQALSRYSAWRRDNPEAPPEDFSPLLGAIGTAR